MIIDNSDGIGGFGGERGEAEEAYVIKVKLDLITNIPCCGRVGNVELPVSAYVDLVGCWCDAAG